MTEKHEMQAELADDVQPFTMIQNAFLDDATLSANAFRVFIVLKSFTSGRAKTKTAFPSYATLKTRCNIGANATLARAIRELEKRGWIARAKRSGRSSLYTLRATMSVSDIVKNWPTTMSETDHNQEVREQEVSPKPKTTRRVAGFGTVITEHADERIAAYLTILKPEISAGNAEIIAKRIHPQTVAVWRDVLTLWAERGYNRTGFADMFERYDTIRNQVRVKNGVHHSAKGEPVVLVAESYDL